MSFVITLLVLTIFLIVLLLCMRRMRKLDERDAPSYLGEFHGCVAAPKPRVRLFRLTDGTFVAVCRDRITPAQRARIQALLGKQKEA